MRTNYPRIGIALLSLLIPAARAISMQTPPPHQKLWSGDTPDVAGPIAPDLSPAFTPKAVAKAMRKVGDWELVEARPHFNQDWTFAALYRGFMAAAKSLHHRQYQNAMLEVGRKFAWKLGPRQTEGDDQAIGYTYLDLYRLYHDPQMLEPTKAQFDRVISLPDVCTESCPPGSDKNTPLWWWADSSFMAPPVWAELYSVTGKRAYLDHMDQEWWVTYKLLYDAKEHLYSRDASYIDKHEANGKKVFWSRGNGWVMGGIALVLQEMPSDYPSRPKYIETFGEMAARLVSMQGEDGLWRPGLLNADAYPLPEVSGSAFIVYGLAWGINHGILDRATYLPAVQKGWAGLVSHIYADGRLGCIQPVGPGPGPFKAQSSYVYGVGAFLMAGSEVRYLAQHKR
ncbi:MAG TPA: glycoside hydrolase family 88 protein [Acidobacteriaceae bacterium]|nr:glycoside hydrolase family 88 protein [Acidobacteriaceae bacterium]